MSTWRFFLLLFAALLAARLCHSGIVWAEEALPLAAAAQMERGAVLYRDIWFDKPPLLPYLARLWGADAGVPLRLAGSLYALLCCALAWAFARDLWGEREARIAAALLAFFLVFDTPSAVTPIAADLLLMAPHLAAVWLAWRRRPLWAGACAGAAFLANAKASVVVLVCLAWQPAGIALFAAGFLAVCGAATAWLWAAGALPAAYEQVWQWGRLYASGTFVADPLRNAVVRTLNWSGFHAAILLAALPALREHKDRLRWGAWLVLCFAAAAAGWRFFPRYFFQLLPPVVLLAARGFTLLPGRRALALALLLAVPLIRFGPRYALLAAGQSEAWSDTAMDRDSRAAAARLAALAQPGDTLFVWGFRPELYVYTKLPAATRFLDSQPLTGVPADRHLTQSQPVAPERARAHRAELTRSRPVFVLDGLGLYNPSLALTAYPDLSDWLSGYREVARTGQTVIYRREEAPPARTGERTPQSELAPTSAGR